MIKNTREILKDLPEELKKRRRVLCEIASSVIEELTPGKLLKKSLMKIDEKKFKRIAVFSIGKAARPFAAAALQQLKRKPDLLLIADRGHPLPTSAGEKITQKMMAAAAGLTKDDCSIVLISGGGSAMFTAPAPRISLEDKIKVTKALLVSGATIQEMNIVRKHLSRVKGGNFAKLLYPATVYGFVISDVAGNDLGVVASGPLSPDASTFKNALTILKKYKINVPPRVMNYLERGVKNQTLETPKAGEKYFKKVRLTIIADQKLVIQKALKKANELGVRTKRYPTFVIGEAAKMAPAFVKKAQRNSLLIGAGETTVTCCKNPGYGGRNQEFVLSGSRFLKKNQTLLSIGTDGVDGICPEKVAGAIADSETKKHAISKKMKIETYLASNDSYSFFKTTGGLIKTGPTGTNLGDLILLY